jgi:hypothetical protein
MSKEQMETIIQEVPPSNKLLKNIASEIAIRGEQELMVKKHLILNIL